jgi:hypothetical protein
VRDIGDEAPRISLASRLKSYFAGSTEITDRSLEVLAGLSTLESIELEHTVHVTNSGIAALALLRNLQQVSIGGLPLVTRDGASIFLRACVSTTWLWDGIAAVHGRCTD